MTGSKLPQGPTGVLLLRTGTGRAAGIGDRKIGGRITPYPKLEDILLETCVCTYGAENDAALFGKLVGKVLKQGGGA